MRRLLIARHGQSIWNQESKFTGWTNIPLNRAGKIEAISMGRMLNYYRLAPTIIYSSIMYRAVDTSSLINSELNNKAEMRSDWRLNEKHYGTLEGVERSFIRTQFGEEYTKKMRADFTMMPPIISKRVNNSYNIVNMCNDANKYFEKIQNGESKKDVYNRAIPFYLEKIVPTIDNDFPLIVTHKHTARVLMKHILNINDVDFEKYKLPENKIIYIELDENMKEKDSKLLDYKNYNL
tara:strand:+ start:3171 stop:3878 length:708 start_codon:yes stop_codon:yes gene_type:complete